MLEFLDPHAEPGADARSYGLGLGVRLDGDGDALRIGLLANGFADSEVFIAEVGRSLARRLPRAAFTQAAKPNPSLLVADDLFDELRGRCDAVVGAYGH